MTPPSSSSSSSNNRNTALSERARIAKTIGTPSFMEWTPRAIADLSVWQKENGLTPDGDFGPKTRAKMEREWGAEGPFLLEPAPDVVSEPRGRIETMGIPPLKKADKVRICSWTFIHESGSGDAAYRAKNLNGEYEGRFDRPRGVAVEARTERHWASKYGPTPAMIGLSLGRIQHTQDGGGLGKVLKRCFDANPNSLRGLMNAYNIKATPEDLLAVVCSRKDVRIKARSARVQPVGGEDLWTGKWLPFLDALCATDEMINAQNAEMFRGYLDPALEIAKRLGIDRHAFISVLFDIAVQCGKAGLARYVNRSKIGPVGNGGSIADVTALISALPAHLRERRRNILRAAPWTQRFIL